MTSTTIQTIDGIQVIADEPVESPLSTPDRPVFFSRIRRYLLADETTRFGCTECSFTAAAMGMVRNHVGSAHKVKSGPTPPPASVLDMTVGELLEQGRRAESLLAQIEKLAADRNDWKAKARKLQADLDAVRKALGRLGIAGLTEQ